MHFIVARGVDGTYFYANDPNKSETPRKQEKSKFKKCLKKAFIFYPKKKVINPEDEIEIEAKDPIDIPVISDKEIEIDLPVNLNGAIIDISKWQGTIDFNKLKNEVSLVIVRASCGSDKDVKFDEYATKMNEFGIPFGVYCYSYAADEDKAKDEVQKMINYASKYNPLFYVMDAEESKINHSSIKAFAEALRAHKINKIGCYVAHNYYERYKYSTLQNLFDFTWIPRYGKNSGSINNSIKPSYFCDLWQYTSNGKIAGISGNVDMNVITRDGHNLEWFLKKLNR